MKAQSKRKAILAANENQLGKTHLMVRFKKEWKKIEEGTLSITYSAIG
jgi:ATP-dependent RNA circularization protein (DNA/RNA ligase family)